MYDATSANAIMGNGFRDLLLKRAHRAGLHFCSTELLCLCSGSHDTRLDVRYGDVYDVIHGVHFELKASDRYRDTVCVSTFGRDNFAGKFYLTSYMDMTRFMALKARGVHAHLRLGELDGSVPVRPSRAGSGPFQVLDVNAVESYARSWDEFLEKYRSEYYRSGA